MNCSLSLQQEIYEILDPAYEELFDKAEEHALRILLAAFAGLFGEESDKYSKVSIDLDSQKRPYFLVPDHFCC